MKLVEIDLEKMGHLDIEGWDEKRETTTNLVLKDGIIALKGLVLQSKGSGMKIQYVKGMDPRT